VSRPKLIDPFLDKVEEWVDRSEGKVRADVAHDRLVAMGFSGTERTTRRAVAVAKAPWRAGTAGRTGRGSPSRACGCSGTGVRAPQVPGPDGSQRGTVLFCAWLAWSRFRVVLPVWDRALPDADRVPGYDAADQSVGSRSTR